MLGPNAAHFWMLSLLCSTCPEVPNASALPATGFVPIRKLAKVKIKTDSIKFRRRAKKSWVLFEKKISTNLPSKMEAFHTGASISKVE
jgi:hypothetical protein